MISIQAMAQNSQSPLPDKQQVQIFLTVSSKNSSPVSLTSSDLSVSVDKRPARVNELHSAKDDRLVFAVVVDTSKSEGPNADVIRNAVLQIFQSLAVNGNQG